jgi:hypothetical protein
LLFALAGNPAALVAQVNHDLMYGSMSAAMQTTLVGMVGLIPYNAAEPQAASARLLQSCSPPRICDPEVRTP